MPEPTKPDPAAAALRDRLRGEAEASGYRLNPDDEFTLALMEGLLSNQARYGYLSCPCRLAAGEAAADLDIVCPCDYRDADVEEFGACYCGLYVSEDVYRGRKKLARVPERRPEGGRPVGGNPAIDPRSRPAPAAALAYPVWRCRVCGYLCARDAPPGVCPICKASKERFERFL
jgi:ferredoxin-thioredoxin reductase catalytic chain